MTLADLLVFLLEAYRDTAHPLTDLTITKCLLRAYEMGLEEGRKEAHGSPVE